jgi:glycosyltransferase involved in cell wall biosynthesis
MNVAYVTMRFPTRSETFAGNDIRVLHQDESTIGLSVYTMRPPPAGSGPLLRERDLTWLPLHQGTLAANLGGMARCVRHPLLALRAAAWLLKVSWKRPSQLATSLALLPRSVGILCELRRDAPDVVHLFWGHYPSIVGYLVLTSLPDSILSMFLGAYDMNYQFGGTAWVARRAHLVSTHARWNFPAIEALGVARDRIHLAYHGIDSALFNARQTPTVRYRLVAAGRLDRGKAFDDVLRVFRAVHARWPDATLRVLGDGPERARLEQLCRSLGIHTAVTFVGHVSQREVARELAEAEVFLHMSLDERLPNVVKEAMASRCVCVVTETQAIEELVADRRTGFVVPRGDVDGAADRIGIVFEGHMDLAPLLDAAADHIARCFDVRQSMASYRTQWNRALALHRAPQRAEAPPNYGVSNETFAPR